MEYASSKFRPKSLRGPRLHSFHFWSTAGANLSPFVCSQRCGLPAGNLTSSTAASDSSGMSSSSNAPSPHPQSREVAAEGLLNNLGEASLPADGSLPTRKPRTRARGRKRRGGRADDEPGDGACDEDGGEPGNDELRINGRAGEMGRGRRGPRRRRRRWRSAGSSRRVPPPPQAPPRPPQARAAAAGDAPREGSVTSSSHASSSGAAFPNADENNLSERATHDHFLNNDGEEETPRPGTPETTETAANKGGELPQPLPPQQPVSALTGLPLDTSNDSTLDTRPLPDTSSGSGDGAALDELLGPMSTHWGWSSSRGASGGRLHERRGTHAHTTANTSTEQAAFAAAAGWRTGDVRGLAAAVADDGGGRAAAPPRGQPHITAAYANGRRLEFTASLSPR